MAAKVRRWRVEPDQVMVTQDGEIPCVSREEMVRAIMDGEAVLAVMGGILEVRTKRVRTDLAGEAVTQFAVVAWYESDAARAEEAAPADSEVEGLKTIVESDDIHEIAVDSPDGLDPSTLEEEDVSSIPEGVR